MAGEQAPAFYLRRAAAAARGVVMRMTSCEFLEDQMVILSNLEVGVGESSSSNFAIQP